MLTYGVMRCSMYENLLDARARTLPLLQIPVKDSFGLGFGILTHYTASEQTANVFARIVVLNRVGNARQSMRAA
jgi:hypothetical protein